MIQSIYFFISLFLVIIDIEEIMRPKEKVEKYKVLSNLKKLKDKNPLEYKEKYDEKAKSTYNDVFYFIWTIIGLLTSQWFSFIIILFYSIFISRPIGRIVGFGKIRVAMVFVNGCIGFCFWTFAIINYFHLNINTFEFFKSLFY